MKIVVRYSLMIALVFFLISCTASPTQSPTAETITDDQLALNVLFDFLEYLSKGNYDQAAQLYGGSYEVMQYHNPAIDPNDQAALFQNACTINGAICLPIKSASLDEKISETEFVFKVEFLNTDKTLFVLGPCCGGNETDSPPQSVFYFTVVNTGKNKFLVMDMPPYAP